MAGKRHDEGAGAKLNGEDDKKKRRAHGEGSVFFDKRSQSFVAQIDLGYEGGKRKRKQITGFKTQSEAAKKARELQAALDAGENLSIDRLTTGDFLEEWFNTSIKGVRSESTATTYETIIRRHLEPLHKIKLRELSAAQIQRHINTLSKKPTMRNEVAGKPLSPQYIHQIATTLAAALNKAIEWGYLTKNPAQHVETPRVPEYEADPFTPEEAMMLMRSAWGTRDEPLIMLGLLYGLRIEEAMGVRLADVNEKKNVLIINGTKTLKSQRTLPIISLVAERLPVWTGIIKDRMTDGAVSPECHFICKADGLPVDPTTARKRYYRLLEETGLRRVRYHDLRHTCGTLLTELEVPLPTIAKIMGHTKVSTTMKYTKVRDKLMVSALDRFALMLGMGREIEGIGLSNGLNPLREKEMHAQDEG